MLLPAEIIVRELGAQAQNISLFSRLSRTIEAFSESYGQILRLRSENPQARYLLKLGGMSTLCSSTASTALSV